MHATWFTQDACVPAATAATAAITAEGSAFGLLAITSLAAVCTHAFNTQAMTRVEHMTTEHQASSVCLPYHQTHNDAYPHA